MKKFDNIYDLHQLQLAKQICKDVPEMLKMLDKMTDMCYSYIEYRDIARLIQDIQETRWILEVHHRNYKPILDNKGKIFYESEEK